MNLKVGWHFDTLFVEVTNSSNVLPGGNVIRFTHGVPYVSLLFRETFPGREQGDHFIHRDG